MASHPPEFDLQRRCRRVAGSAGSGDCEDLAMRATRLRGGNLLGIAISIVAAAAPLAATGAAHGRTISEFSLKDGSGQSFSTWAWRGQTLVVVFLGAECPLGRLYVPRLNELARTYGDRGVKVIAVDSNASDSAAQIARFAAETELRFPMLRDERHRVADACGATRSPEAFVLDAKRIVRYHGRIDDQLQPGANRGQPIRSELRDALDDLLAGRAVRVPETEAKGCFIDRGEATQAAAAITFGQIAPILQAHCVECHRAGSIAPFPLTTYEETAPWAATITEVVQQNRMPPWSADPRYGHFLNERRLSDAERTQLLAWCAAGAAEGPSRRFDKLTAGRPSLIRGEGEMVEGAPIGPLVGASAATSPDSIGRPDCVVSLPEPQRIPAEGLVDYRYVLVDPHFAEDRWISAVEVYPDNRKALHHCTVFLSPPNATGSPEGVAVEQGALGSFCLATYTPGTSPAAFPAGMAKLIPAGWRLVFVLHYVTSGAAATDRTSVGLKFAEPSSVRQEVATKLLVDLDLTLAPFETDHVIERSWHVENDVLLLSMFPHMHLRGRSFRYDAIYPDGTVETLLSVPNYDFNWQHRYVLASPKRLPAGTTLRCTAHYDNSAANPNNPAPQQTVHAGKLTTDEMFNAYFDFALADEDRVAAARWAAIRRGALLSAAVIIALGLLLRRVTLRDSQAPAPATSRC